MLIVHRKVPTNPEFIVSVQDWYHALAGHSEVVNPNSITHAGTGEEFTSEDDRDKALDNSEVTMRRYC